MRKCVFSPSTTRDLLFLDTEALGESVWYGQHTVKIILSSLHCCSKMKVSVIFVTYGSFFKYIYRHKTVEKILSNKFYFQIGTNVVSTQEQD